MVLPNAETLPPSKPLTRPLNTAISQVKKDWSTVIRESKKTSSYDQSSHDTTAINGSAVRELQPFRLPSLRPFLKGTSEGSILLEITNVKNKKLFLKELKELCDDNTHLWSIEDVIRQDYGRLFAEITFSPEYTELACTAGLRLPSFDNQFHSYYSLPPDSEVLTITFTGLLRQYGRKNGGLAQLHNNMLFNFLILAMFAIVVSFLVSQKFTLVENMPFLNVLIPLRQC